MFFSYINQYNRSLSKKTLICKIQRISLYLRTPSLTAKFR